MLKFFIEKKIKLYYYNILKNDLIFFDFLTNEEKFFILLYFNKDIESINIYIPKIKENFLKSIQKLEKSEIYNFINFIQISNIFIYSKKNEYKINFILEEKNIDKKILNDFFTDYLTNIILDIFISYKNTFMFFKKYFNYEEKINIYGLENNILYLKNILEKYYNFFINFYIYLLNKKDKNIKYIFPFYLIDKNKFLLSVVDLENKKEEIGGENNNPNETDINKIKLILNDMENNNNNIKNYYTKDEIRKLETILENKKINKLIYNNNIKLSKQYKNLINSVIEDKNIKDPDKLNKYNISKDFFNKLFVIENETENKDNIENLYDVYKNEPDKKKFIEYISDKIYYNNYLQKNNSLTDDNNLKKTSDMLVVFDKVFSQIINTDLHNNMLNLSNDDIKFILILEVLNTLKQNVKQASSIDKNITLNIYKEISGLNINDEQIKLN